MAHQAGAYSGFFSMKQLEVFLLSLDDAMLVHCRVTLSYRWCPFIHLGGERHCESKVSCPRTQHKLCPWPGLEPELLALESSTLTMRPLHLPLYKTVLHVLFNNK